MKKISKNIKLQALFMIVIIEVLALLLCVYLYRYNTNWIGLDVEGLLGIDTKGYEYSLEITPGYRTYKIEGYCYKPGEDTGMIDISVVLYDQMEMKYYQIRTDYIARPDVTKMVNDGFSYDNSGFVAEIRNDRLEGKERYRIFLLCTRNNETILWETDYYL